MLMKRICPNCELTLSMSSNYFCENCGSVLPEELRFCVGSHKNVQKIETEEKIKKHSKTFKEYASHFISQISMRSVMLGLVLGIMISISFYLFFKTDTFMNFSKMFKTVFPAQEITYQAPVGVVEKTSPSEKEKDYMELGLSIKSGVFGQHSVTDYVPYETPFYMEFNDISTMEPYFGFLGGELFTLNEKIKENTESFYSAFYMSKGIKSGWVILTFLKDESLELGTYNKIFTDKIGKNLIISSEPVLIDEVKLAKSEVTKNLSMHPLFISTKPFLSDTGQILIFKLKKEGEDVVEILEGSTLSDELKSILEKYMDSNSPYLVIK